MKKKILIICGGLLGVVVIAAGMFQYYVKPKYVTPLVIAVEEFLLEDEETVDLLLQEYEASLKEDITPEDQTKEGIQADVTKTNAGDAAEDHREEEVQAKGKPVVGKRTMADIQKEVAPGDFKAGMQITSKLDTGHLMALSRGGMTPENKREIKAHLDSRLTPAEYSQLRGFVGKYAYLLK